MIHGCVGGCGGALARDDQPFCGLCWLMVPPPLRRGIEAARADGTGSTGYAAAVLAARDAVTAKRQPA